MMRPGTKAPELSIKTTDSETWDLQKTNPDKLSLVVFYRGMHCPVCKDYLQDLNKLVDDYKAQGVSDIIAISGDTKEKAEEVKKMWELTNLNIGYDQNPKSMANWGLFISGSISDKEPKVFAEPGLFLIDKSKDLVYCATNSMPFARPKFNELLDGIKYMNKNDYPPRGKMQYEQAVD